jgi:hypothetical protein
MAPMLEVQSKENKTFALGGSTGTVTLALLVVVWPGYNVASISAAIKLPPATTAAAPAKRANNLPARWSARRPWLSSSE